MCFKAANITHWYARFDFRKRYANERFGFRTPTHRPDCCGEKRGDKEGTPCKVLSRTSLRSGDVGIFSNCRQDSEGAGASCPNVKETGSGEIEQSEKKIKEKKSQKLKRVAEEMASGHEEESEQDTERTDRKKRKVERTEEQGDGLFEE